MVDLAKTLKVYVAVTAAVYALIPTLDRWHLPVTDNPQDRVERARRAALWPLVPPILLAAIAAEAISWLRGDRGTITIPGGP